MDPQGLGVPLTTRSCFRLQHRRFAIHAGSSTRSPAHAGILARDGCRDSLSQKEALLEGIGVLGAVRIVPLSQELTALAVLKDLRSVWDVPLSSSVYVSADGNDFTDGGISKLGCKLVHFVSGGCSPKGKTETGNPLGPLANVQQLQEIPVILADLNKGADYEVKSRARFFKGCFRMNSIHKSSRLQKERFRGLPVPLPAVIQVDHGAFQYKMYILGDKLIFSCRKSTPNGEALAVAHDHAPSIVFDSLKSLPIAGSTGEGRTTHSGGGLEELNLQAVQTTSDWLRNKLDLTIIGFDFVVQAGTSDYVVVDVNYFPSFNDVPDAEECQLSGMLL